MSAQGVFFIQACRDATGGPPELGSVSGIRCADGTFQFRQVDNT